MAKTAKFKQKELRTRIRTVLANAYSFVRSSEYTKSIANVSYEQLLENAIDRIEGTTGRTINRAPRIDRIQKMKQELGDVIVELKKRTDKDWSSSGDDAVQEDDAANTEE